MTIQTVTIWKNPGFIIAILIATVAIGGALATLQGHVAQPAHFEASKIMAVNKNDIENVKDDIREIKVAIKRMEINLMVYLRRTREATRRE